MAYINKPKKVQPIRESLDRKFYNTTAWVNCRTSYLVENPMCEKCKENNILTLATEIHHKQYLSTVHTLQEKFIIGLDYNNLKSLCKDCHHEIHNKKYIK